MAQPVRDGHDGLFGVPLEALSSQRACPPPLVAEVQDLLVANLNSAAALATALDSAAHPSMQQRLEALCTALNTQGAHAALASMPSGISSGNGSGNEPSLSSQARLASAVIPLGVLLRLLHQLPEPAVPCELYAQLLGTSSGAVAALLRKRLPPSHATFLEAIGSLVGQLLLSCGFNDGLMPTTVEEERALHALLFALTPALLRPEPDIPMPQSERAAATRAVRALCNYHLQRERFRALNSSRRPPDPPTTPATPATAGTLADGSARTLRSEVSPSSASIPVATPPSSLSPGTGAARGGSLAMKSVASAIQQMFEREVRRLQRCSAKEFQALSFPR